MQQVRNKVILAAHNLPLWIRARDADWWVFTYKWVSDGRDLT